ncbi:hypothetical protein AB6N24_01860 [Cellulomonas sp. 179-A 4D5 NHS]|uniref:hypothetical protein n=1 Tax=Cellulomonas sp. 179-A 4D5 NHS TaxID=3142378 RepID=UPI00399F5BD4
MTWSETAVIVAAVLLLVGWRVWVAATRLDRLHRKVAASRAVVEAQLVRRASAAVGLSSSGLMDPVSSLLVGEAAWAALAVGGPEVDGLRALPADVRALADVPDVLTRAAVQDRGLVESELSQTLRAALDDPEEVAAMREEPDGAELVEALAASWYRAQLARRFHNEAVAQAQRVRRSWVARTLRLAGRAPMPRTLELDDAWPAALGRPGEPAPATALRDRPSDA